MEESIVLNTGGEVIELPPGFRFHPTDEEIVSNYLTEKVKDPSFTSSAIGEVDLNKNEPWDLPKKAKMGEKEWYFFFQRDRKYPTGMRTNRATEAGYWKATGKDKEIFRGKNNLVGMKKTLVFYRGRAPKGEKTNWVMHEYRLEGKLNYYTLTGGAKDEWVVCRVFHKSTGIKKTPFHELMMRGDSFGDDYFDTSSLPALVDPLPYSTRAGSSSFNDGDHCRNSNGTDFKLGMASSSRSPDGNYVSNYISRSILDHSANKGQDFGQLIPSTSYHPPISSSPLYPQMQASNSPLFGFQPTPNMPGYNFQASSYGGNNIEHGIFKGFSARNEAFELDADNNNINRNCKVEQFSSNQSMISLSQDTGISNEINTADISSNQETASNNNEGNDLEGPSMDFDFLLQDYS